MSELVVIRIRTLDEMAEALSVRRHVFIEEQQVPADLEIDEHDIDPAVCTTALHVLARLDGTSVATGRLLFDLHGEGRAHIGRVAVLEEARGRGYGRAVMLALHNLARELDYRCITLAAQLHALGFYERLGYVVRDEVFLDAGIEHRWMDLDLAQLT